MEQQSSQPNTRPTELLVLLLLGFVHSLIYLTLMPPWQHYDEPTHFEYAQLLALRGYVQGREDYELAWRNEIADSMYRFRFDRPGVRRTLDYPPRPDIGITELDHPPVYYWFAAIPVQALGSFPVEVQLYGARLVSITCYLLTILCAYRLGYALDPLRPELRLGLPLLLLFMPTFSDIMTAVNNDALANLTGACFFLGCVLLIRNGLRPTGLLLAILGLVAALLTKRSAVGLLPILPLALFWAIQPRPTRWWVYTVATSAALVLIALGTLVPAQEASALSSQQDPTGGMRPLAVLPADVLADDQHGVGGLMIRPWVNTVAMELLRIHPSSMLEMAVQWERNRVIVPEALRVLMISGTTRLGWSHVNMHPNWRLVVGSIIGLAACGLLLNPLRRRYYAAPQVPVWRDRVDWLAFWSIILAILAALSYIFQPSPDTAKLYLPAGRYMFIVLLPSLILLLRGLEGWIPRTWRPFGITSLVFGFIIFDTVAWSWTVIRFYYI